MLLRPHHLLCIQNFTGHGYDARFTAHMTVIVRALAQKPHTAVTLVRGCDDLCAACPHAADGRCTSQETVEALDRAVLAVCRFADQEPADALCTDTWSALAEAARTQILDTDAFRTVCANCEWFALCCKTLSEKGAISHGNTSSSI